MTYNQDRSTRKDPRIQRPIARNIQDLKPSGPNMCVACGCPESKHAENANFSLGRGACSCGECRIFRPTPS